ncbi:MAG: hypothetical protein HYX78_06175 [Armatimonadetes bacterium]|nr:hypothetical protein [Armatimonadota bacterium]
MLTKVFPAALALAISIGVLAELALTRSKIYTIAEALTESETAVVTVKGKVRPVGPNVYLLSDGTGRVELQTCPAWYRRIEMRESETVSVTGEILRPYNLPDGVLYVLAVYTIEREDRPEIVLRTKPGKPPWATSVYIPDSKKKVSGAKPQ